MKTGRIIRIQPSFLSAVQTGDAADVLHAGGILLYPSDTVYGLACRAGRPDSVRRLAAIKGYGGGRPFIVLALDIGMTRDLAEMDEDEEALAAECWPGPFTMVLRAGRSAPGWVCAPDGTIAVRVPADPLSRAILGEVGYPLVSTSANTRDHPAVLDFASVEEAVRNAADLCIDGGALEAAGPSRIVRVRRGFVEILR